MVANPEQTLTIELYGERGTGLYTGRPWASVRFRGVRPKRARPPVWGLHPLQRSLEAFRRWVMVDRPYLTPADQALPVLAAIDALYRSAESGQREQVVHGP
jgi:predicted dehydrogenase